MGYDSFEGGGGGGYENGIVDAQWTHGDVVIIIIYYLAALFRANR